MDTKTKICLWVILIGLVNFLAFAVAWFAIGGDAIGGRVVLEPGGARTYYLKSPGQPDAPVSRAVFVYSGVHCISIWITVAAVMLAMLTLAKDRIVSSMRSTIMHGRMLITILAVVITLTICVITYLFILEFAGHLSRPHTGHKSPTTMVAPK
jgi:small-conductance mechanosensitive channel